MESPKSAPISLHALRRLPGYYNYLRLLQKQGVATISAPAIAKELGLNEVQVRKDLAAVSTTPGRPRTGFEVGRLLASIGTFLGYHNVDDAILVGAGRLGRALLGYPGFEDHGVRIIAGFDLVASPPHPATGGREIFAVDKLGELCRRLRVHIGILTVPPNAAQAVCDTMVQNGILAVWNFAPVHLSVPPGVLVQNENMAASLAMLSQRLAENMEDAPKP